MKKFFTRFCIYMVAMIAIAVANNVVMLKFHPLSYYYTAPGWWLSAAISTAEALVIWPLSAMVWKRWIIPSYEES